MKKFILMFLVAVLCLSLAACGNGDSKQPAAKEPASASNTNGLPAKPDDFPTSAITVIVGYSAGGSVDAVTRLLMQHAQKYVDVPIVVTNVTGASGAVAVTQALKNKADGATMVSIASGALIGDITGAGNYDFFADLDMVALQDNVPYALSFRADDDRFSTVEEFLQYVKDHPGELSVATSGVNNANYFATQSFINDNGYEMKIVPFNGSADAKAAFLGKHVDVYCEGLMETKLMVDEGSAICVCTFGDKPYIDGVATNEELGIEISVTGTFRSLAYKSGTSQEIIDYMSAIFKRCFEDPELIAAYEAMGFGGCINYLNPADSEKFMQEQYDHYLEFCRKAGIAKK